MVLIWREFPGSQSFAADRSSRRGEATQANFPTHNSYRNPVIAEALKSLGYVNRFGYGVQRAQALLLDNGNPPLEFDFDKHSVRVKVRKGL